MPILSGPNRYASGNETDQGSASSGDVPNELHQELYDFTETKKKIEALIRFKQSLIDQEHSDFTMFAVQFAQYKLQAMDAINQHFDAFQAGRS